jgi:hypothetical protein
MSETTLPDENPMTADSISHDEGHRQARVREGLTMALYIGLSLLAVMVALPRNVTASLEPHPAVALFLTSISLLIAHQLAFRLSARLAHQGALGAEHLDLLAAQVVGGLAVTAVAVIPVILFEGSTGVVIAELALLAFIAVVGYASARTIHVSRVRALLSVLGVITLVLVVLWIKELVHH